MSENQGGVGEEGAGEGLGVRGDVKGAREGWE